MTFGGVFGGGQIIHYFSSQNNAAQGFLIVFVVAAASRFLSSRVFSRVPDAALHVPDDSKFTFWRFIIRARYSNFVKFVIFVSCMNFAVSISGPYFAMYMLTSLKLSYAEYTMVVASMVLAQFAVMKAWGKVSDQFGNRQILRMCGLLVSLNPFMWLMCSDLWFILLTQLYSGIFWAGFSLAAANFVFDAVTPQKRARCFAYQPIINGSFVLLGSVIGGWLAIHPWDGLVGYLSFSVAPTPLLVLFSLS